VVSEPAKAMDTAMVITSESVMNSGRSVFACMNLERRSGWEREGEGVVVGRTDFGSLG